jgi:hypothetical protein
MQEKMLKKIWLAWLFYIDETSSSLISNDYIWLWAFKLKIVPLMFNTWTYKNKVMKKFKTSWFGLAKWSLPNIHAHDVEADKRPIKLDIIVEW